MDWHGHLAHEGGGLGAFSPGVHVSSLKVGWECLLARLAFEPILPLLDLDPPHHWFLFISICNGMILIAERVWIAKKQT